MTAPRLSAKEKADRAPVATLYGSAVPSTLGAPRKTHPDDRSPDEWTADRWSWEFRCAIVGPCLTGAHTTPEPEPAP
jgi:hypothetical protein